jgi:hypothetical protein
MVTARTDGVVKPRRLILRSSSGVWLSGVLAAVFLFFTIDALVHGDLGYLVQALPWQILVIWALFVLLVRPRVELYPGRLLVVNLFRTRDVPWSLVDRLSGRYQVILTLTDGSKISCWGAPATGLDRRPSLDLESASGYASSRLNARRARRTKGAATTVVIESTMFEWKAETPAIESGLTTTVDRWVIIVSVVVVALGVADLLATILGH